jgi:hypothetical protein
MNEPLRTRYDATSKQQQPSGILHRARSRLSGLRKAVASMPMRAANGTAVRRRNRPNRKGNQGPQRKRGDRDYGHLHGRQPIERAGQNPQTKMRQRWYGQGRRYRDPGRSSRVADGRIAGHGIYGQTVGEMIPEASPQASMRWMESRKARVTSVTSKLKSLPEIILT